MQPIVILGGFLSSARQYQGMRAALIKLTRQPVTIVPVQTYDWLPVVTRLGWARLLARLDDSIRPAVRRSPTGRVTLVGHSIGGVLARLYLSPQPFLGKTFAGHKYVDHLITLGSPHQNRGKLMRGGRISQWVEQRYPGAAFQPHVKYTSVAGKWLHGDRSGSGLERWAYDQYREICGQGNVWGDGLIPVEAALLEGAEPIVLERVSHFSLYDTLWFGYPKVVPRWWLDRGGENVDLQPG